MGPAGSSVLFHFVQLQHQFDLELFWLNFVSLIMIASRGKGCSTRRKLLQELLELLFQEFYFYKSLNSLNSAFGQNNNAG